MSRPTLFGLLLSERRWDDWEVFSVHFAWAARAVAAEADTPRMAHVSVPRRTFDQWADPERRNSPPSPDAARVLQRLTGHTWTDLFEPAPPDLVRSRVVSDRGGRTR